VLETAYRGGTSFSGASALMNSFDLGIARQDSAGAYALPSTASIYDLTVTATRTRTSDFTPPSQPVVAIGEGGLVWLKRRDEAQDNGLFDTTRGATKYIQSNGTDAEITNTTSLTNFNSDGFTLGSFSVFNNDPSRTYASWTFRKAEKFFDVVTYTGNGTTQNIAHNLGSVPGCIIVKQTNGARDWPVYHRGIDATNPSHYKIPLNKTEARANEANIWNDTEPTSTHFTVGSDGETGGDGNTYVAYLFAHDAGGFGDAGTDNVISCGSYTGNGSADGPEIDLGWEPQWVMFRRVTGVEDWIMFDNMRGMVVGGIDPDLRPNRSQAEGAFVNYLEPNATGFKLTDANSRTNENGDTYIYIAIRRGPMRAPTSGTEVFAIDIPATGVADPTYVSGFPVDMALGNREMTGSYDIHAVTRLTGIGRLQTNLSNAEVGDGDFTWDYMNGYYQAPRGNSTFISWMFRRAPGFFDVVAYTGTGNTGV
jgi:hypothetical protein